MESRTIFYHLTKVKNFRRNSQNFEKDTYQHKCLRKNFYSLIKIINFPFQLKIVVNSRLINCFDVWILVWMLKTDTLLRWRNVYSFMRNLCDYLKKTSNVAWKLCDDSSNKMSETLFFWKKNNCTRERNSFCSRSATKNLQYSKWCLRQFLTLLTAKWAVAENIEVNANNRLRTFIGGRLGLSLWVWLRCLDHVNPQLLLSQSPAARLRNRGLTTSWCDGCREFLVALHWHYDSSLTA